MSGITIKRESGMFIGDADIAPASGKITITESGTYDVASYAQAEVDIPTPDGKITITANGTDIDVAQYATADVAVPTHEEDYIDLIEGDVVHFQVPNGVTKIKEYLFEKDTVLEEVTFPNSCTEIGNYAFAYTTSLHTINITDYINKIGECAFLQSGLTSVTLHSGITIGEGAFQGTSNAQAALITANIDSNPSRGCFSYQQNLANVTFGSNVTAIGKEAFTYCYAFRDVTIPSNIVSIGEAAFHYAGHIRNLVLNEGLTTIEKQAFADGANQGICADITIPASVTTIGEDAFSVMQVHKYYILNPNPTSYNTKMFGNYINNNTTDIYFAGSQATWEALNIRVVKTQGSVTMHYDYVPT